MQVELRLFATFREGRFKRQEMEFSEGTTIADVISELNIPADEVGILLRNGFSSPIENKLDPNDVVSIFPSIGGG